MTMMMVMMMVVVMMMVKGGFGWNQRPYGGSS
jgi:hypothetical protein